MGKDWGNDRCSPLQLKKITDLVGKLENYEITEKADNLTKGLAHQVIEDLLSGNPDRVNRLGIIRRKEKELDREVQENTHTKVKLRYRVTEGGHLWNYTEFRLEAAGTLVSYETEGIRILFQIIEVDQEIEDTLVRKYGVKISLLD
jgi:hypothetical protein